MRSTLVVDEPLPAVQSEVAAQPLSHPAESRAVSGACIHATGIARASRPLSAGRREAYRWLNETLPPLSRPQQSQVGEARNERARRRTGAGDVGSVTSVSGETRTSRRSPVVVAVRSSAKGASISVRVRCIFGHEWTVGDRTDDRAQTLVCRRCGKSRSLAGRTHAERREEEAAKVPDHTGGSLQ